LNLPEQGQSCSRGDSLEFDFPANDSVNLPFFKKSSANPSIRTRIGCAFAIVGRELVFTSQALRSVSSEQALRLFRS
jgi:hypothetical protein